VDTVQTNYRSIKDKKEVTLENIYKKVIKIKNIILNSKGAITAILPTYTVALQLTIYVTHPSAPYVHYVLKKAL